MFSTFFKNTIKTTMDIPDYNIAIISGDLNLFVRCLSNLDKEDIKNVNAILFDDTSHNKNPQLLEYLLDDPRFNYNKTNELFVSCVTYGQIPHIKILIERTSLFNEYVAREALENISNCYFSPYDRVDSEHVILEEHIDKIKYLMKHTKFNLEALSYLFLNLFFCYSKYNEKYGFSKSYIKFITDLYIQTDGQGKNHYYKNILDPNGSFYNKELINFIKTTSNITAF